MAVRGLHGPASLCLGGKRSHEKSQLASSSSSQDVCHGAEPGLSLPVEYRRAPWDPRNRVRKNRTTAGDQTVADLQEMCIYLVHIHIPGSR